MGKYERQCVLDKTNVSEIDQNRVNENFTPMACNFKIMFFLSINLDNYYCVISKGSLIILCNHDLIEVIHKEATSLTLKFETLLKE